ncbi:MAG: PD-(D/E)XK nuclease superfamily protein [Candidatus Argoarchaeum ethanivorans]|uniref:PD-(D/E)XK nuclease superfamily protein n=1 Tax=Candidatus Argoarchaeum ethanivorans TaxID=2608793 RepID=A0A812A1G3_9EURY|nr:MAG: PD-(D/E)XK nuclease superfamily protein [Candidatus Argoarchaeum ethanivorans]
MQVFMTQLKHHHITEKIIGAAYKVHNTLGSGFLEKVYQNSLAIELKITRILQWMQSKNCLISMRFNL